MFRSLSRATGTTEKRIEDPWEGYPRDEPPTLRRAGQFPLRPLESPGKYTWPRWSRFGLVQISFGQHKKHVLGERGSRRRSNGVFVVAKAEEIGRVPLEIRDAETRAAH